MSSAHLLSPFGGFVCVQGFVSGTKLGVYTMKHIWDEPAARQDILDAFLSDQRVRYELSRSELPLSRQELRTAVLASIRALIDGLQASLFLPDVTLCCMKLVDTALTQCQHQSSYR